MSKKKRQRGSFFVRICLVALCAYFVISLVSNWKDISDTKKEIEAAQLANKEQIAENDKLRKELSSGDIDEYVEGIARDKLGYVMPGERVYYDVSVND